MLVHAVGLVCGLGAATFATEVNRTRQLVALVVGFGVASFWLGPDPVWIGGTVALAAALRLASSGFGTFGAVVAGALAGMWVQVLESYGLSVWIAAPLAVTASGTAALMGRHSPRFAPPAMREDALLGVGVLGLGLAAAPAVLSGWQSAVALNLEPGSGAPPDLGPWMMLGFGATVSLGGLHSLWRRG